MTYRILLVEDDAVISRAIAAHIQGWGYETVQIQDFEHVMEEFGECSPHLVLMDISLPFYNGFHWCSRIRQVSKVPIIFISSAADNMNIVLAMNMGGDDFIMKPFDLNVLTAKVQAMLRRTYDFTGGTELLEHRGAILNLSAGTLNWNGETLELTKNEFRILKILMEQKEKVVSRDALMDELWATDSFIDDNTLTVNVTRLRKKLEQAGLCGFIVTKKGIGYKVE
ncbi:MAG: response regulator transcription factor [Clostridiales bacterium]|nr:response regulator transcription factor [Clostridiales bacterium]